MSSNLRMERTLHPLHTKNKDSFKSGYSSWQSKKKTNQLYVSRIREFFFLLIKEIKYLPNDFI